MTHERRYVRLLRVAPMVAVMLAGLLDGVGTVAAAPPNPADEALPETIWFDAQRGELVPVEVEPIRDDSAHRASRWEAQPKTPAARSTSTGTSWRLFGLTLGQLFAWALLATMLVALVALLVYAFMKADIDLGPARSPRAGGRGRPGDEPSRQRMQQLPAELGRPGALDWRQEAERAMRDGRFERAIIFLFGHQLLLLDRAGILRLSRGKTNRRYLSEARREDPVSAEHLQATVMLFERSYFGRYGITTEAFAEPWQRNEQLERRLHERREAAP